MTRKKIIFIITAVLVIVAVAAGVVTFVLPGGPNGAPDHLTVAQALHGPPGQDIKVGGEIAPGSVTWDNASYALRFTLIGEGDRMQVEYHGVAPDGFKPGSRLLVEGSYDLSGVFLATSLTTTSSPLCRTCHG